MVEFLFIVLQFILWLPPRLVCLFVVLLFSPIWIWFKETRMTYGYILLRLIWNLDVREED